MKSFRKIASAHRPVPEALSDRLENIQQTGKANEFAFPVFVSGFGYTILAWKI